MIYIKKSTRYFVALLLLFMILLISGGFYYSTNYLSHNSVRDTRNTILKASEVTGATYYVAPTGNNSNSGSLEQPWKDISTGIGKLLPGDTLYVRAGTYPPFIITKSGVSDKYITISGYENERPIITGGSEEILIKGASYIKIKGFEIKGATASWGAGIRVHFSNGLSPNYNIIEGNLVYNNVGSNTSGILIEDGSFNKIINNEVFNNYFCGIVVISHASINPTGSIGNEVIGNKSYNNVLSGGNSDGIKLEGPGTQNSFISKNIMYGNSDDGLDTWDSSHNIIMGNIAYGNGGSGDGNGFKLGGSTTGGNNVIKQNIAYDNKLNGFESNGSGNNEYYNNISYNNAAIGFEDGWKNSQCTVATCRSTYINNIGYNNLKANFSAASTTAISHNNIWYSDALSSAHIYYNYALFSTLQAFYSASGNRLDNPNAGELSSYSRSPLFANATAHDFSLQSSSLAINTGDAANPAQVQTVGVVDIGAIEFGDITQQPIVPTTTLPTPSSPPLPTLIPTIEVPTTLPVSSTETSPPQVIITSPSGGSKVGKKTTISATADDPSGISKIMIFIDNATVADKTCHGVKSCGFMWNNIPTGTHLIRARAYDNSLNTNWAETSIFIAR